MPHLDGAPVPHTESVGATHRLDLSRLSRWLAGRLPGVASAISLRQFSGGQSNPTFLLQSGGLRWVLRKRPSGALLPSAHQIDREYRVMAALAHTDVPVPAMRLFCDDPEVIGTPFYVMSYLEGRVLRSASLAEVPREQRAAHYQAMSDTLARLHLVDVAAAGLAGFGKPGDYFARQLARWARQTEASPGPRIPAMDWLIEWLPRNVPEDRATALTHGDFRIDNLVFHPALPQIIGVLDWELSTLGHPLADAAYACLAWHLPPGELKLSGLAGLDLAALGIPSEQDFLARYCARTGRKAISGWSFYLAFSLFRLAAIAHGIAARAAQGNASSSDAARVGALAADLAARGKALAAG
ncbi:MAG TPA: phosphotransferase [Myxococcales bacterium]|jgi:aminoglycoside phosphotransferase (APT) family kinase protein|nr:phosphotransferase [Myxococcales bacterium]